jgi:phosphatidylglycerol:prolipoprotein diacylglycerol transferase
MLTYPHPNPILLKLSPIVVTWYACGYIVGIIGGWWFGRRRAIQRGWQPQQIDELLLTYVALGVVLGGRIGYILFYSFNDWLTNPLRLLRVWEGGMSFHGGLLGVVIAILIFARRHEMNPFAVGDFVAPLTPLGLVAGRIGNFINGELWGAPSDLPWAMRVNCQLLHTGYDLCTNKLGLPANTVWTPPLHPSQLYEALLEGVVLFIILWLYSAKSRPPASISGLCWICYGTFRFLIEFVRMPDSHLGYLAFGWLTMGQILTLPMVLIGTGFFIGAHWYSARQNIV